MTHEALDPLPEMILPKQLIYTGYLLTPRQQEIALLTGDGLQNKEIGETLGLAKQTVANHLRRIFRLMEETSSIRPSRGNLVVLLIRLGEIDIIDSEDEQAEIRQFKYTSQQQVSGFPKPRPNPGPLHRQY